MTDGEKNLSLLADIAEGKEGALEELVYENMGLVRSVALRFKGRGTEYEDLLQIGSIGMIKAAKSFDLSYGTAFSTYAVPLIAGEIRRHLRDDGPIKVSRTLKKIASDAMRQRERIVSEEGREPRISELAALIGVRQEELSEALEASGPVRSIYEAVGKDEEGTLEDLLPAEGEEIERLTDRLALRQAMDALDPLHRQIVVLRYYKELSQEQTGRILGLSQVKVSREEKKIMALLRHSLSV
ncbi:MAG: sigma-70 family RNA polymerase sigma factor [Clostridia bacterium]|nr:sigma-70 family RNA polymerase sigma factor [Clostridia bacterium]